MDNRIKPCPDDDAQKIECLCKAAQLLLENGSETYRVEETVQRMSQGMGLARVNIAAFPTSIFIEAGGRARVLRISHRGTNTLRIAQVNAVSRRAEQGALTCQEVYQALEQVALTPGASRKTLILACGLAAASFCLLFGGDLSTFLVTFSIGMLTQVVQPFFQRMQMGSLFGNFSGGLLTAVLALTLHEVIPYTNPNAAIIGGIMPLVSGLLMTTAVRDTMYGDLISGMTRALEALLLAAAVALGVYAGLMLVATAGGIMP